MCVSVLYSVQRTCQSESHDKTVMTDTLMMWRLCVESRSRLRVSCISESATGVCSSVPSTGVNGGYVDSIAQHGLQWHTTAPPGLDISPAILSSSVAPTVQNVTPTSQSFAGPAAQLDSPAQNQCSPTSDSLVRPQWHTMQHQASQINIYSFFQIYLDVWKRISDIL